MAECFGSLHICRMRVTRLAADGSPDVENPNAVYVSDTPVRLGINPEVAEGEEREVIDGCDCTPLTYRSPDRLKRFNFEFENALLEPPLVEMLFGAEVIPGEGEDFIGNVFETAAGQECVGTPLGVALEAWSERWRGDARDPVLPFWHWVFTRTLWRLGDNELNNEFMIVNASGYTMSNSSFGDPYEDRPVGVPEFATAAYWATAGPMPEATDCAYGALVGTGTGT